MGRSKLKYFGNYIKKKKPLLFIKEIIYLFIMIFSIILE